MLMALTRLSRLANLSQLNIGLRTYTTNGVIFSQLIYQNRVNHQTLLMKISSHSTLQTNHCVQLRPYRCIRIAQPLPFFCHGLGNMNQSPAIPLLDAWLQTCLQEIGVDTDTFKAHSVRGAACSSATWSGVTATDILNAADWSSKATFQQFYHWEINPFVARFSDRHATLCRKCSYQINYFSYTHKLLLKCS